MDTLTSVREENPTVIHFRTLQNEIVQYEARCEAPTECDWSFRHLSDADPKQQELFKRRLGQKFAMLNVRTVYAPTVSHMSAVFLPPEQFNLCVPLNCGVVVQRPADPCDATEIAKHSTFSMSAAGCSLLVLSFRDGHGDGRCFVAHAGKASLIDLKHVLLKAGRREHSSVVDALIMRALAEGASVEQMMLRVFFTIPWEAYPHSVDDPTYGEKNAALVRYLELRYEDPDIIVCRDGREHLSLEALIMAQTREWGVNVSCHHPLTVDGPHAYTTHPMQELSGAVRNLVTLTRYA